MSGIKVKLLYFKDTGKFYTDGEFEIDEVLLTNDERGASLILSDFINYYCNGEVMKYFPFYGDLLGKHFNIFIEIIYKEILYKTDKTNDTYCSIFHLIKSQPKNKV